MFIEKGINKVLSHNYAKSTKLQTLNHSFFPLNFPVSLPSKSGLKGLPLLRQGKPVFYAGDRVMVGGTTNKAIIRVYIVD